MIKKEWFNILILIVFVAFTFYFDATASTDAAGNVITAYDDSGLPITVESRFAIVYLLPIVAIAFYTLILIISEVNVYRAHLDRFFERFFFFKFIILLLLLAVYLSFLLANQDNAHLQIWILVPIVAIGLFYIGHLFDHLRSDYFSPWIKGRNELWEDTHVLGAWLFYVSGFVILLTFIFPTLLVFFLSIPIFAVIFMIILYSYVIFKKEHEHPELKNKPLSAPQESASRVVAKSSSRVAKPKKKPAQKQVSKHVTKKAVKKATKKAVKKPVKKSAKKTVKKTAKKVAKKSATKKKKAKRR